jgi:hypothetical protein
MIETINGYVIQPKPTSYTAAELVASIASISYGPTAEQVQRVEEEDRLELIRKRAEVLNPDETVTVRIAYTFYADHVSRDLPAGKLISHKGNFATVELDYTNFAEVFEDAKYYAEEDEYDRKLSDSARRVMVALNKVTTPWVPVGE